MHRYFKPFTEQTIFLLKRILQDLLDPQVPMSSEHVRTVTRIISSNQMSELLFTSYGEAIQVLAPFVDSLLKDFSARAVSVKKNENFVMSLADWTQDLKALANVALLSGVGARSLDDNSGA